MMSARTIAICAIGVMSSTPLLKGQSFSQYRNFELGSDVASVSALAGVVPTDAKVLHRRPAVLQDLEWRPSHWLSGSPEPSLAAIEQILFSFCDDHLFHVVVDYSHERTEGMTVADMTEAVSAVYGPPRPPASRAAGRPVSRLEIESGLPVARWGDAEHGVVLYRTSSYDEGFRLIVTDMRAESAARKAEAQAQRLDEREAPQREAARRQKERDDGRLAATTARTANKRVFKP